MRNSFVKIQLVVFCFLVSGCKSLSQPSRPKYLDAVMSIPLGGDKSIVFEKLGQPSKIESSNGHDAYIYVVPFKQWELPKVTIWIGKNGNVVAKNIRLFEQDGDSMTQTEIETLFKTSKFKTRNASIPKGADYIPFERYLYDEQAGIEVEINTAQSDRATYINWDSAKNSAVVSKDP